MARSSPPPIADDRPASGIWSLDDSGLASVERFDVGPAVVLVPTEQVLLSAVDLPLPSLRRRAEALPFAIEDRLAEPLGAVHVALGAEIAPQRHLAAAVSHETMRRWVALLAEAGLDRAAIMPDALALPLPAAGSWSVDVAGNRALVRSDDGAGLALPIAHLTAAWRAAGQPACVAFGAPLPAEMNAATADLAVEPLAGRLTNPALDLRQGPYAAPRRAFSPLLRRIVTVAAIGAMAHGAIAAADTLALDRLAARRAAETRALVTQVAPGVAIGNDLAAGVADMLPANGSAPSRFLPLLGRVTTALQPLGAAATLRSLSFDGGADTIAIEIEAADIAALQRVGQTLQSAGIAAESGAATAQQGKAVGSYLIRGSGR